MRRLATTGRYAAYAAIMGAAHGKISAQDEGGGRAIQP